MRRLSVAGHGAGPPDARADVQHERRHEEGAHDERVVRRRPAGVKVGQRRWRAAAAGSIEQLHIRTHGYLPWRAGH
jgi:hypothetical protein